MVTLHWTSNVLAFLHKLLVTGQGVTFQTLPIVFSCECALRSLSSILMEKTPFDKHSLKISSNGLQIDFPQIFNNRMLIISWLCALFKSNFWIILNTSSLDNLIFDKYLSVMWSLEGTLLSLLNREHFLAKNKWNSLAFLKKIVANSFLWNKGGIMGIFLLLREVFNRD